MTRRRVNFNHLLMTAAAVGTLTLPATQVEAASAHVTHAVPICSIIDGTENQAAPSTTGLNYIHPMHPAAPPALVFCGLQRLNISNTTGLQDLDVRVKNFSSPAQNVSCTATSLRPTDGSVVKSVTKVTSVPAFGSATVDFGTSLNSSAAYGHYYVTCDLPSGFGLFNILIREY